jgi:hypothetical protein
MNRSRLFLRFPAPLVVFLLIASAPWACGQEAEDCLICHEDSELTKNRDGRVVSLFVDLPRYESSIHGEAGLTCIDCHQDLADADFPHAESLAPVDCAFCHDDVAEIYRQSLHGQAASRGEKLAPRCWDCHGAHDILPRSPASTTSPRTAFSPTIPSASMARDSSSGA